MFWLCAEVPPNETKKICLEFVCVCECVIDGTRRPKQRHRHINNKHTALASEWKFVASPFPKQSCRVICNFSINRKPLRYGLPQTCVPFSFIFIWICSGQRRNKGIPIANKVSYFLCTAVSSRSTVNGEGWSAKGPTKRKMKRTEKLGRFRCVDTHSARILCFIEMKSEPEKSPNDIIACWVFNLAYSIFATPTALPLSLAVSHILPVSCCS